MSEMPVDIDIALLDQFQVALHASALPRIYENPDNYAPWDYALSSIKSLFVDVAEKDAMDAVRERVREVMPDYTEVVKVLQSGNTTMVTVCNPAKGHAFVASDPTKEWRAGLFSNFNIGYTEHSLGGVDVQSGYYNPKQAQEFSNSIKETILNCSKIHDQEITVSFTGFSNAAAKSSLVNAEMINEGVFDHPKIAMGDMYQFGSPDYSFDSLAEIHADLSQQAGIRVWDIELEGDLIPSVLNFFTHKVGTTIVLKSDDSYKDNFLGHSFGGYRAAFNQKRAELSGEDKEMLTRDDNDRSPENPNPVPELIVSKSSSVRPNSRHARLG